MIANSDSQSGVPGLNLYRETYNSGFPQSVQRLRYGQGSPGIESREEQEIFLFLQIFIPALRLTQPPIQWVPGFFAGSNAAGA